MEGELEAEAVVVVDEGHLSALVGEALHAELLALSHEGGVADERLVDLIGLSVGAELQALGVAVIQVVGPHGPPTS